MLGRMRARILINYLLMVRFKMCAPWLSNVYIIGLVTLTCSTLPMALPRVVTADAGAVALEPDQNRPGLDFRTIEVLEPDPRLCSSACLAEAGCQSFTFVKPSAAGARAVCRLKQGTPPPVPDECCVSGLRPTIPAATAESILFQRLQSSTAADARSRLAPGQLQPDSGESLATYAKKCDAATGIKVPVFNCNVGSEVPGNDKGGDGKCDRPNVLNGVCDPGSRFQVLPGATTDAVAVAHCRKQNNEEGFYGDIAVIQHNKKNGATCFYQALGVMPGQSVPAPRSGSSAPWADGQSHWLSPFTTWQIGCTGCHDNGGFIRSSYLAQMKTPPNRLPNTETGFDNLNTPLKWVGKDFAKDRSWKIEVANAPGDNGPPCSSCHRIAVSNHPGGGGTGADFALKATAATQSSKNPHGPSSPIWMRPGQIFHNVSTEETAKKYEACAIGFRSSGFRTPPPGCKITEFAGPFIASTMPPQQQQCLEGCQRALTLCKREGGFSIQPCLEDFKACKAECGIATPTPPRPGGGGSPNPPPSSPQPVPSPSPSSPPSSPGPSALQRCQDNCMKLNGKCKSSPGGSPRLCKDELAECKAECRALHP